MDMRKYNSSSFYRFDDVRDGPIQTTIVKVSEGQFGRPVLLLETGKRLTVNVTNNEALTTAYGFNSADWVDQLIELYAGKAKYQGKDEDSVLVKPLSVMPKEAQTPLPPISEEMDDEIPF